MPAGREGVERRAGDVVRDGDDRNGNALVEAESPGWNRGSVEDDRRRAGAGGILDRGDRIVARADEGGAAGDHAQSVSVEEGVQRRRGKKSARARTGAPFLRPRRRELPGMRQVAKSAKKVSPWRPWLLGVLGAFNLVVAEAQRGHSEEYGGEGAGKFDAIEVASAECSP